MKKSLLYFIFIIGSFGTINAQTIITFYTTLGDFEVELYDELKPITAGNFLDLVEQEFYDGIIFHRVISNFVVQGGDPTGTGYGGPGYTIEDEFDASLSNVKKTLSMANAGPNTGGSQFFINLKDNIFLDFDNPPYSSAHPVFGIVISGWDVVELIENVPVDGNDRPITPVVMNEVRVTQPLAIDGFNESITSYSIYPNPVTNIANIDFNLYKDSDINIAVFDILGKNVMNLYQGEMMGGANNVQMDVSNLNEGIYFVKLQMNNQIITKKIMINN